jgi:hypothetical protein
MLLEFSAAVEQLLDPQDSKNVNWYFSSRSLIHIPDPVSMEIS